mmetsp:Transcript_54771/g.173969  ORF Transcript_54771/g.173969 Transcript_54771/m.173969 type:complete len:244 (+) Transcript_54771:599-1330(+)
MRPSTSISGGGLRRGTLPRVSSRTWTEHYSRIYYFLTSHLPCPFMIPRNPMNYTPPPLPFNTTTTSNSSPCEPSPPASPHRLRRPWMSASFTLGDAGRFLTPFCPSAPRWSTASCSSTFFLYADRIPHPKEQAYGCSLRCTARTCALRLLCLVNSRPHPSTLQRTMLRAGLCVFACAARFLAEENSPPHTSHTWCTGWRSATCTASSSRDAKELPHPSASQAWWVAAAAAECTDATCDLSMLG